MTSPFPQLIHGATAASMSSINRDELHGFALCPDEDITSFYQVHCTRKWVEDRQSTYPEIGEIPVEWPLSCDEDAYNEAHQIWEHLQTAAYDPKHFTETERARRFNDLVLGLQMSRKEGVFAPDTLVLVCVPDPSNFAEELAMKAADLLNQKSTADRFAKATGYGKYR